MTASTPTPPRDPAALRDAGNLVAAIRDDARIILGDGWSVLLSLHHDPDTHINDYDYLGGVAHDGPRNDFGYPTRPRDFDGNAERLDLISGGDVWWQPPEGCKRGTEHFEVTRRCVREVLEYGYQGLVLQLHHRTDDGYVRTVDASLWGIEPFTTDDHLLVLVGDLYVEAASQW